MCVTDTLSSSRARMAQDKPFQTAQHGGRDKERLKKRGGVAGRDEERRKKKAGEARRAVGSASRAPLSCLCTPQLADIILAARPGGVSAEVSTVTRRGPPFLPHNPHPHLQSPPPHFSFWPRRNPHPPSCIGPSPKKRRSPSLLNHRFTTFSCARDPTALVSMVTGKLFVSCGSK